jgi:hypothetical protein
MAKEPGNFLKAAAVFAKALLPHPVAKWVQGVASEYEKALNDVPDMIPFVPDLAPFGPKKGVTFTRKQLIDVFLNTQYAHQGEERRKQQYAECLAQVKGSHGVLFWLFATAMWECALNIRNAGAQIVLFTEHYCKYHGLTPITVGPPSEYIGMGQLEKRGVRKERILREKAEELAMTLWKDAGRPEGGPMQFINQAREQLKAALGGTGG